MLKRGTAAFVLGSLKTHEASKTLSSVERQGADQTWRSSAKDWEPSRKAECRQVGLGRRRGKSARWSSVFVSRLRKSKTSRWGMHAPSGPARNTNLFIRRKRRRHGRGGRRGTAEMRKSDSDFWDWQPEDAASSTEHKKKTRRENSWRCEQVARDSGVSVRDVPSTPSATMINRWRAVMY